jgi:hypothetical protein
MGGGVGVGVFEGIGVSVGIEVAVGKEVAVGRAVAVDDSSGVAVGIGVAMDVQDIRIADRRITPANMGDFIFVPRLSHNLRIKRELRETPQHHATADESKVTSNRAPPRRCRGACVWRRPLFLSFRAFSVQTCKHRTFQVTWETWLDQYVCHFQALSDFCEPLNRGGSTQDDDWDVNSIFVSQQSKQGDSQILVSFDRCAATWDYQIKQNQITVSKRVKIMENFLHIAEFYNFKATSSKWGNYAVNKVNVIFNPSDSFQHHDPTFGVGWL